MSIQTTTITADEFFAMPGPRDGTRYELVKGELTTMAPTGNRHGKIAFRIAVIIGKYLEGKDIGTGYTAEAGFILGHDPDTVRAPDVAFVSKARIPSEGLPEGYAELAPDLAVEVVSPSDRADDMNRKLAEYFAAGTRLVWMVYPSTKSVMAYRSLREIEVLFEGDELDGKPVFEDFRVKVGQLFG